MHRVSGNENQSFSTQKYSLPRASVLVPPRECVLAIWCLQNSELVINTTVRAGIIIFDLSDNMAQNTIKCGFGSISGLKF